jgi:hypothetical protein
MLLWSNLKGAIMISKKLLIGSVFAASLLLVGCGGGSSDDTAVATSTGYLVDSPVANVDYDCIADNDYNKTTATDGRFTCRNMAQVRFRIGELVLGELTSLPADGYVFPQDLVGVARDTGIGNEKVIAMARLLQSLDTDGDPTNGITIRQDIKDLLVEVMEDFDPMQLQRYFDSASIPEPKTRTEAQAHLRETIEAITGLSLPDIVPVEEESQ